MSGDWERRHRAKCVRAERKGRRWDVPEMARRLALAAGDTRGTLPGHEVLVGYIRRWESARTGISERYILLYLAAFEIETEQDLFGDRAAPAIVDQASPYSVPSLQLRAQHDYVVPDSLLGGNCETVEVHAGRLGAGEAMHVRRSEFLMLGGATLASLLAPPLIHRWPDQRVPSLPELTDDLLDQFRAQTEGFRWLDRQQGSFHLLPATTRHARNLANLWRLIGGPVRLRAELALVAADTCHLVAYQAFDQGERAQAIEWYRCSAELAAQASTPDLYVFAMCGVAYMHARNRDHGLALSVLQQLERLPLSVAARCYLAVYEAHAHGSVHHRDQALTALDRAHDLARRTEHEAPSPWLGIADSSFVSRQAAMVLAELADTQALDILTQLEAQTPATFRRYRVTLHTNFALTHARLGEVDQAVRRMTAALERNKQTYSVEKYTQIREVRAALEPYGSAKAFGEVDELIRAAALPSPRSGRNR